MVCSLYTPARYSHGNQLSTPRIHCCNHWLTYCTPSTVPFAPPLDTHTLYSVSMSKVQLHSPLGHLGQQYRADTIISPIFCLFSNYLVLIQMIQIMKALKQTRSAICLSWKSVQYVWRYCPNSFEVQLWAGTHKWSTATHSQGLSPQTVWGIPPQLLHGFPG